MKRHFFICSLYLLTSLGCTSTGSTVFWSKSGSTKTDLERDKEECQTLQRSVGADDWKIHKCLEVKGWTQVEDKS